MVKRNSPPPCEPRYATQRTRGRATMGGGIAAAAEALGQDLLPWQRQVADIIGELDDEGIPAYREVIFSTPRQSGKTILQLAAMIQRAIGWAGMVGAPQKMLYSAQTGNDARKKLVNDWQPILHPRRAKLGIRAILRGMGNEEIQWRNGSLLTLMGSTEGSGHGKTLDFAMVDELFDDQDGRRHQALIPAMATKPFAQILTASTMGTPSSVAWNAKVQLGRASVEANRSSGIAYFEWSADPDADPEDPATWWSCMPALGHIQSERTIRDAFDQLELNEFRRAFLNIPTMGMDEVIPAPSWAQVCSPLVEVTAQVLALDCDPDRKRAAIVAAGGRALEVVDVRNGTGWVVDRCVELHHRFNVPIAVAAAGPAGAFVAPLRERGVEVTEVPARDEARAAQLFLDSVVNLNIEVRSDDDLDDAVRAATKRPSGDGFSWGRKNSQRDISSLVAASIGLFLTYDAAPVDVAMNVW